MKKIICLLLIHCSAFANELVYCPEKVDCTAGSCTFEQHPMGYWLPSTNNTNPVLPGEYRVSYVSAPYHVEDGGYAICVYTHTNVYQTLMLRAAADTPLVIYEGAQTDWRHEETWGECHPNPLEACPLQEG